ncbi:MAG: phosphate ABC transporter substrate-binding protein [Coriobacteriaceae bacterium]|nr:phosphate ABC transporter substrate-binding protein [Coriobacteriaceae bacterium]
MFDYSCSRRSFLGFAGGLAAVAGLGLAGCGASDAATAGSASAEGSITGEVTYDGASSFQALVEAAAEQFMNENPDCVVSGSGNGSGAGLTAVAAGTVTIGNSDVFAETKLDADAAANLVDHEVAVVGMGPIVSKNVTVDDLTLEQLKGIFGGKITNWKEVGGEDAEIVVVNRKEGSGTRATFEDVVFAGEKNTYKPAQPEQDKSGDVQTLMAATDNAISYIDFSHFDDAKFTAIKVGGVEPESKNVLDNSFPIWATEHMYCAKDADDATKAFLEYMLSDDVQGSLVEEQGFIPVSEMTVTKDATGKVSAK